MSFLDAQNEPLRRYVYGVLCALVAIAVVVGYLTKEQAVAITGILSAVLTVPAVEFARSKVTPVPAGRHSALDPAPSVVVPTTDSAPVAPSPADSATPAPVPVADAPAVEATPIAPDVESGP
jgi:hypothetical protein